LAALKSVCRSDDVVWLTGRSLTRFVGSRTNQRKLAEVARAEKFLRSLTTGEGDDCRFRRAFAA
jgi:hypothetical protein